MRARAIAIASALAVAGCGASADLSNLRCAEPCQDVADPFLLKLVVDYEDPQTRLYQGKLVVKLDDTQQAEYALDGLMEPGVRTGSVKFDVALHFRDVKDGQRFRVGVFAKDVFGEPTDEATLELELGL